MNNITTNGGVTNFRLLVIDDNPAIHEDFRKVLGATGSALKDELDQFEA
ncbi:MAG: hypothetical protein H0U43_01280, partial [Chthoniobacterales bacterium]|nr:hypothetical protein [Chthoniobacterales bacterium]